MAPKHVPSDKLFRTAVFLKARQIEMLQTLSSLHGAPIAELIRRALDLYLDSRKSEIKK